MKQDIKYRHCGQCLEIVGKVGPYEHISHNERSFLFTLEGIWDCPWPIKDEYISYE